MTMTRTFDLASILWLTDELRHRNIWGSDVSFNITWAARLGYYFDHEPAAVSVNYPAYWLGSKGVVYGELEVRRNGTFALHGDAD